MSEHSKIILLFGGTSSERRVSVASAKHLSAQIPAAELWYWSPTGEILSVQPSVLASHDNVFDTDFQPEKANLIGETIDHAIGSVGGRVVFLGLHGGDGENGTLQKKLEERKIAFTASSSAASALAMDKGKSKDAVRPCGLLMAKQLLFTASDQGIGASLSKFQVSVKAIVIKPSCDGSSKGLAFVGSSAECEAWLQSNKQSKDHWIAEERINGRELTVGVITHNGCLMVLPPSEVVLERNKTFDFQAKYHGVGNKEITPAELSPREAAAAQSVSILAHSAIGCFGYSRTDMIMTDGGMYFLETNTLPGMTIASFMPQQLRAAGIAFKDFIDSQVALANLRYS
jgi:D-alanine-D-alanine ligase